jgi:hypothetical protein
MTGCILNEMPLTNRDACKSARSVETGTCGAPRIHADLPPWQIKFLHLGCGKSTRRANHFGLSETVSSPKIKNILVFT